MDGYAPSLARTQFLSCFQACRLIVTVWLIRHGTIHDRSRVVRVNVCYQYMRTLDDDVDTDVCIYSTGCGSLLTSLHDAANQTHAALHNGVSSVDLSSKRLTAALLVGLFAVRVKRLSLTLAYYFVDDFIGK